MIPTRLRRSRVGPALAVFALLFGLVFVGAASPAGAEPGTSPICHTAGRSLSGNHDNLIVRGDSHVPKGATLNATNLWLTPGSCVDGFSLSTVHVSNDIVVAPGATLALGCAPLANYEPPPGAPPGPPPSGGIAPCFMNPPPHDTVGGSIVALSPRTMYLTAATVDHDVVSLGGGQPNASYPIKDMDIGGNLVVAGWNGGAHGWLGVLRSHVGGNVVLAFNHGHRSVGPPPGTVDTPEVDGNTIGHNLVCFGNSPPAIFGDAPPPKANTVGGRAIGECSNLTTWPPETASQPS